MQQSQDHQPIRVLAIEDNPSDVELLRMALDSAGFAYAMTVVIDGAEAMDMFSQMNQDARPIPDIAVLDLNLPKYDGLEILETARGYPKLAELPIVILTSSSSPRERARIQVFGLVRYVTKPSDLDQYMQIGSFIRDFVLESRGPDRSSLA